MCVAGRRPSRDTASLSRVLADPVLQLPEAGAPPSPSLLPPHPPGLAVGAPRLLRLSRNLPEHRVPACLLRSGPYQSLSTVLLEYANFCVVFESVRGRDWASTSEGTQWPLISYSGPFCVCRSAAVMASENKVWARGAGWAWVQTPPRGADPRVYSLLPCHTRVFARARLSASPSRSPLHLLPPVRGRPWWPERNSLLTVSPETRAAPPFKVSPGSGHLSPPSLSPPRAQLPLLCGVSNCRAS